MKFLLSLALLCWFPAQATTYFIAGCDTGKLTGCAAGSDGAAGTSSGTAWASCTNLSSAFFLALAAGDQVKFMRGGSLRTCNLASKIRSPNATPASPIVFDTYTKAGFADATDSGTSSAIGTTTLTDGSKSWTVNTWAGYEVTVVQNGKTQNMQIVSNTSTVLTLQKADASANWYITPTGTPTYTIQGPRSILGNGSSDLIVVAGSGASSLHGGYTFQNLQLLNTIGTDTASYGALLEVANGSSYVLVNNVTFTGGSLGFYCESGVPSGGTVHSTHATVRNSILQRTRAAGLLSACPDSLYENNILSRNGVNDSTRSHNVYLDGPSGSTDFVVTHVTLRANWILNSDNDVAGNCRTTAIVVHNQQQYMTIADNLVMEETFSNSNFCAGISVSVGNAELEGFADVVIQGNTVVNYPGAISVEICQRCVISNNYIYGPASDFLSRGIAVPGKDSVPGDNLANGDLAGNNVTIVSNTIYITVPNQYSRGIQVSRDGTGHIVASNLIYMGAGSTSASACFTTDGSGQGTEDASPLAAGAFTTFDYNLCYFAGTQGVWNYFDGTGTTANGTFALQKSIRGHDTHSIQPTAGSLGAGALITAPTSPFYRLLIPTGSAAKNTGHPTLSSILANGGRVRASSSDLPDIGADEFGANATAVPEAPTAITIQ